VADNDIDEGALKVFDQRVNQINGAMLSACTAYRDSQIATPFGLEAGYPSFKKTGYILKKFSYQGLFFKKIDNRLIFAC
jgi:predicted GH43/DUF377 family glycosyl hydrolase